MGNLNDHEDHPHDSRFPEGDDVALCTSPKRTGFLTHRKQREGWRGRVGYEFKVRYCGLTKNSWMWQSVLIYEWGHEDPTLKFTYEKIYVTEILKVGDDGCTINADKHYSFVYLSNDNYTSVCPLCDYYNFRQAIQYDNVSVSGDTNHGDHGSWFPEGDPDREWIDGEDKNYHLLSFKREGVPCLGRPTPLNISSTLLKADSTSGKLAGSWTYEFWWALPCSDWVVPDRLREPQDPPPSPQDPPPPPPVITPRTPGANGLVLEPNKPHSRQSKPFGQSQPVEPQPDKPVEPAPREPERPESPGGGR